MKSTVCTLSSTRPSVITVAHVRFLSILLGSFSRCFHSRQNILLENLALRQQLAVLKRRHPRPKLSPLDKLFWALACQFWSAWKQALMVVTPETVVRPTTG